ncbi:uncharacterized protein LOC114915304 isoform X4 [Cajanus cajan]|uniref:uncharacterized protein LOC114915304 isoform X4 n=1 Tax=Cajanus cajan TaxID=3821 RepID=UPI0010FB311E|nr:uncharacterized protein LOC114915304 isoform X4 [Cajanus cajan]
MECIISIAEEVDEIVRALCGFLCCKGINMATQQPSYASGISPNSSKDIDDREEQEGNLCRNPHSKIISKIYSSENIDAVEQLQEINNKDVVELLQRKINMIIFCFCSNANKIQKICPLLLLYCFRRC